LGLGLGLGLVLVGMDGWMDGWLVGWFVWLDQLLSVIIIPTFLKTEKVRGMLDLRTVYCSHSFHCKVSRL
jgi:hypothetical protein